MSMLVESVRLWVERREFRSHPPRPPEEMSALERDLGFELPGDVRTFLATTNGLESPEGDVRWSGVDELRSAWRFDNWPGIGDVVPLPVLDANDSNPLCVCCADPLRGFVLHVRHDGETGLRFRSLGSALERLGRADGDLFDALDDPAIDELPPAVVEEEDADRRSALLDRARGLSEEARSAFLCLALDLTGTEDVPTMVRIRGLGDEAVRERANARLKSAGTPEARAALGSEAREYGLYLDRVVGWAAEEGVQVRKDGKELIFLRSRGPVPLNHEMLFVARNEEDFEETVRALLRKYIGR